MFGENTLRSALGTTQEYQERISCHERLSWEPLRHTIHSGPGPEGAIWHPRILWKYAVAPTAEARKFWGQAEGGYLMLLEFGWFTRIF